MKYIFIKFKIYYFNILVFVYNNIIFIKKMKKKKKKKYIYLNILK